MAGNMRNLIEYDGISDFQPATSNIFRQLNVQNTFCLPAVKPDIEQIIKVICDLVITHTKVIRTPQGTSLEGQVLTGWKIVIEGYIKAKIEYAANECTQTVHAAHCIIPFSTYVILPSDFTMGTPVMVNGYIEDIYSSMIDTRCIFNNITIALTADFC